MIPMKTVRYGNMTLDTLAPAAPDPADLRLALEVFEEVARDGDVAVRRFAARWDGLEEGEPLEVSRKEREAAVASLPRDLREALDISIARVREAAQRWMERIEDLAWPLGDSRIQVWPTPVERAGCYVPGGRYPLPSSAVMTVVPARVAGVDEVVVCSPGARDATVAAADLAGADRIFRVGGMQAVAAMALGTASVPKVDVVVGPGNRYVQAAKAVSFGRVGVDLIAGPTEVVVVADHTAEADLVAADLLAQAEHDVEARAVLVALDERLAEEVPRRIEARLMALPTREVAREALSRRGLIVLVEGLAQAADVVNRIAPEHLEVVLEDPEAFLASCRHFGCAFVGPATFEVLGDYVLGTNHVLPTGGAARFTAGLSVQSFLRFPCVARTGPRDLVPLSRAAATLALSEGLHAHAQAAIARVRGDRASGPKV